MNNKKVTDSDKPFWGNKNKKKKAPQKSKKYELTENIIRYAMKHTRSNGEAARFLGIHIDTYKRYASTYYDKVTGLNLYELHKNQEGIGIKKGIHYSSNPEAFERAKKKRTITGKKILNGEYIKLSSTSVFHYLVKDGYLQYECQYCGFNQYRHTDKKYPLRLVYLDGDRTNRDLDNMRVVCYNCYFLYMDNIYGGKRDRNSKKKRKLGDIEEERQMSSASNTSIVYNDKLDYTK